jgi:hypothetical protein
MHVRLLSTIYIHDYIYVRRQSIYTLNHRREYAGIENVRRISTLCNKISSKFQSPNVSEISNTQYRNC